MNKPAKNATPEPRRGDLLQATDLDAVVNPVNCVGVMGKGLAQQFKRRYPAILDPHRTACQNGELTVSRPLICGTHPSRRRLHGEIAVSTR